MDARCSCGTYLPADAALCPHCGKQFGPVADEPAASEQPPESDAEESQSLKRNWVGGALLYCTVISASLAVIVENLVRTPSPLYPLISMGISAGAGLFSVLLFVWEYPSTLDVLPRSELGLTTGMMVGTLELALVIMARWTLGEEQFDAALDTYFEVLPMFSQYMEFVAQTRNELLTSVAIVGPFVALHAGAGSLGGFISGALVRKSSR